MSSRTHAYRYPLFESESKQVDIQSALYSCCVAPSLSNSQICLARKLCMKLICFRVNLADAYIKDILSKKQIQLQHLVLISAFFSDTSACAVFKEHHNFLITSLSKILVGAREKIPNHLMEQCKPILEDVKHQDLTEIIMPSIVKSLLRNPEGVLEAVSTLLEALPIDLSQHVDEILKNVVPHFQSTSDTVRQAAVNVIRCFSAQCSHTEAIQLMLDKLFQLLNSAPGMEYRIVVLQSLQLLADSKISIYTKQDMLHVVVEKLSKYLKLGLHETTLICCINALKKWCVLGVGEETSAVLEIILKPMVELFNNKTTSPLVRISLLDFVGELVMHYQYSESHFLQLTALASQSLDRVKVQHSQTAIVAEGIAAAIMLMKCSEKLPPSVDVSTKMSNSIESWFISPKFISGSQDAELIMLLSLGKYLFSNPSYEMPKSVLNQWYDVMITAVTHVKWTVREAARNLISMVSSMLRIAMELVKHLCIKINDIPTSVPGDNASSIPVYFVEALFFISSLAQDEEKEKIACEVLMPSHHPVLVAVNRKLWKVLLKRLSLNPVHVIENNSEAIMNTLTSKHDIPIISKYSSIGSAWNVSQQSATHLALKDLLSLHATCIQPLITNYAVATFTSSDVTNATKEDHEIMVTDSNQLYHAGLKKQLVSSLECVTPTNVRRSNRLYSYEEEKWDIKIQQEAELRHKQNLLQSNDIQKLIQSANLPKKLQEAIEIELARENSIRSRMIKLDQQLSFSTAVLITSLDQIPQGHIQYLHIMIESMMKSFDSPLSSHYACELWPYVVKAAVPVERTALLLAYVTLRVLNPIAPVNPCWCEESLPFAMQRLMGALNPVEFAKQNQPHMLDMLFSCYLPLIKAQLVGAAKILGNTDKMIDIIVQFCDLHVSDHQFQHELFPVEETLRLLSLMIADGCSVTVSSKVKLRISQSYVKLCQSLSDQPLSNALMNCIVEFLSSNSSLMRFTALKGLGQWKDLPSYSKKFLLKMMIVVNDTNDDVKSEATRLQTNWGLLFDDDDLGEQLVIELVSEYVHLQKACSVALGEWLCKNPNKSSSILQLLKSMYEERSRVVPVKTDSVGRVLSQDTEDFTDNKVGIAMGLSQLGPYLSDDETVEYFKFMLSAPLGDVKVNVRSSMLEAATATITSHKQINDICGSLMDLFKTYLKTSEDDESLDATRHSVVILMGTLAQHLNNKDDEVEPIVHLLLETLDTPSQPVQEAIAKCLPPLITLIKLQAADFIETLLNKLLNGKTYGERRGAAYGVTAIVKGIGIPSLKQYNIMPRLQEAIQNKKNYQHREGALFAFELLCVILGRLFEPYVVKLLPDLLVCYGDGNQYVREAAENTAKTIMKNLSGHGVKMVLPSLLTALNEDQWRTKAGSAELLGTMAYCAPKQLSACLPTIVPPLIEALADSHSKVQDASNQALYKIGSVIKNPEVQELVPSLLAGLSDPNNKATTCLKLLLETEFVHVVDAPSLALIMPLLQRALQLRSTESKKIATQIIANIYCLTQPKELEPYLTELLPHLKQALIDPVPEVRSFAAKALGTMATGIEDDGLKDLLSWLLSTLKSDSGSVDRAGAAQGLGEVLWSQGIDHLIKMMPSFISYIENEANAPHVRDGFLMMFIYLPAIFKEQFSTFISQVLPCILKGLSDEVEYIRDTALKAGQGIINLYADSSVELFLPRLLEGLLDTNWRIRLASVQLMGDLLYCLSGVSGKMSTESAEDDNFGTEEARKALIDSLGLQKRNRVLAGLYLARSDVSILVRQNALHVWKVVVTNTPKTLRDILDILIDLLLSCLSSSDFDKRQSAAHSLGDLLRKLGERILPDIIPLLEKKMSSSYTEERQGVCFGVSELIQYSSHDHINVHFDSLVSIVLKALCDTNVEVRQAAALAFEALHSSVGPKSLDSVLPPLLNNLNGEESCRELALDGLKQAMSVKSSAVLPYLIPKLTVPPINTRALALLSSVAGDSLHKYISKIIPALIQSLEELQPDENVEAWTAAKDVVLSVTVDPGPVLLMEELHKACKSQYPSTRITAMSLLLAMCENSLLDLRELIPTMLPFLLHQQSDAEVLVIEKAWLAMSAIIKHAEEAKELSRLVGCVHKSLAAIAQEKIDGSELPGFALKGIDPIVIMVKDGLFNGTPDEKEESARVIILLIQLSPVQVLSKCVLQLGGPLIRVYGDRHGWNIRLVTLEALNELIKKVGRAARSFMPQLQTSYIKTLNDKQSLRNIRLLAVEGLKEISPFVSRLDNLIIELHNGIKKNDDASVRETLLQAVGMIINTVGEKVKETVVNDLRETLVALLQTMQESVRIEAARCLGSLCHFMSDESLANILQTTLLKVLGSKDWSTLQAQAKALSYVISNDHLRITQLGLQDKLINGIILYAKSDRVPVCVGGLECLGMYMAKVNLSLSMMPLLFEMLTHTSSDVRVAACDIFSCIGKHIQSISDQLLKEFIPALLPLVKDKNTAVKASAEQALIDILQLQQGQSIYHQALKVQDNASKILLQDCYERRLQRQFSG